MLKAKRMPDEIETLDEAIEMIEQEVPEPDAGNEGSGFEDAPSTEGSGSYFDSLEGTGDLPGN